MVTVIFLEGGGNFQGDGDKVDGIDKLDEMRQLRWNDGTRRMWDGGVYIDFSSAPSVCSLCSL